MISIEDKIHARITRRGRGWAMTNRDFIDLANASTVVGKYFTFISNTTIDELKKILLQLTCTQKENLSVLRDLLQRSDSFSLHLSMRIDSLHNCLKSDMFLLSD